MRAVIGHHVLHLHSRTPCRGMLGACMLEMQLGASQASTKHKCVTKWQAPTGALLWLLNETLTYYSYAGVKLQAASDDGGVPAA